MTDFDKADKVFKNSVIILMTGLSIVAGAELAQIYGLIAFDKTTKTGVLTNVTPALKDESQLTFDNGDVVIIKNWRFQTLAINSTYTVTTWRGLGNSVYSSIELQK